MPGTHYTIVENVGNQYSGEGPGATAGPLEFPVNLFLAKNRHTASIPFLERVSPQGRLWATGQNINLSPFDLGYSPHCRFGKKTPQAATHYLKLEKRGQ